MGEQKNVPLSGDAVNYLRLFDAWIEAGDERDDLFVAELKNEAVDVLLEESRKRNDRLKIGPNYWFEKRISGPEGRRGPHR